MKCANVAFSVVPRIGDRDVENWNRVWVQRGLLFWHTFGTYAVFYTSDYLQHIAQPVEGERPINLVFVHPSVLPQLAYECRVITLQPLVIDLCNFKERFISSKPCEMNKSDNSRCFTVKLTVLGKILFIGDNLWTLRNMVTKLHTKIVSWS